MYSDSKLPDTKKWTIYVPTKQYIEVKAAAVYANMNLNEFVSDGLSILLAYAPILNEVKKEAEKEGITLQQYIEKKLAKDNSNN